MHQTKHVKTMQLIHFSTECFHLIRILVVRVVAVIIVVCSCCFCLNVFGNGIAELSKEHIRFKVRTCSEDLPAVKVMACVNTSLCNITRIAM